MQEDGERGGGKGELEVLGITLCRPFSVILLRGGRCWRCVSLWEGNGPLLAWSSADEGTGGGMFFVPVNFAAANLPFYPRACSVSAFVFCFFFLICFSSSSGGGKPEREVAARSFLDI